MPQDGGTRYEGRIYWTIVSTVFVAVATISGSCQAGGPATANKPSTTLRVGVGQYSSTNPINGLRQLGPILAIESLARTGEDGRMQPWLAESWELSLDGRFLRVKLRSEVQFHDGSRVDPPTVAALLPDALRSSMGPVFPDFEVARAVGDNVVEIQFRHPSPFLVESLEVPVLKPGPPAVGTGPFMIVPQSTTDMRANHDYYSGQPAIDSIHVDSYPSLRTAWAEMLRGRLDVLWDVGSDALESLRDSNKVAVFTFTRRYQHVIAFNPKSPALRSAQIRRALSEAIDRNAIVRSALRGLGLASSGPIWPDYWAGNSRLPKFEFDPKAAAASLGDGTRKDGWAGAVHFTCLTPPDIVNERIALEAKRQLAAVGVDMSIEEVSQDQLVQRATKGLYDAVLIEVISGPTLIRPYLAWRSNGPFNFGGFGNATIDAALDRVRYAPSEDEYRKTVEGLQHAFMADPPAIFLAWSQRARAVSRRFVVPAPESGRDILSNLRLWKPAPADTQASRN